MSRGSAETAMELFNRSGGRGDVISIGLVDGEMLAVLTKENIGNIFYAFIQWWVNGSSDEPSTLLEKMVFARMKAHQMENAIKRGVSLKNWVENSRKGGRPLHGKKPSGYQVDTKRIPSGYQVDTKRIQLEEQEQSCKLEDASSKSSNCKSVSCAISTRDGLEPSAQNCTSTEDARETLEKYAPPLLPTHAQDLCVNGKPGDWTYWAARFVLWNCHAASVLVASSIYPEDISTNNYEGISNVDGGDDEPFCLHDYKSEETDGWKLADKLCRISYYFEDGKGGEDIFKRALADAYLYAKKQKASAAKKGAIILERLNKVSDAYSELDPGDEGSE